VRLALVEDVAEMRESWQQLINGLPGFRCSCTCSSGREALRVLPAEAPDVIVMDIQMPSMTGIECTLRLKELLPKTPILILTVSADTQTVFRALEAGADGYLLKRSRPEGEEAAKIAAELRNDAPLVVRRYVPDYGAEFARLRVLPAPRYGRIRINALRQRSNALTPPGHIPRIAGLCRPTPKPGRA